MYPDVELAQFVARISAKFFNITSTPPKTCMPVTSLHRPAWLDDVIIDEIRDIIDFTEVRVIDGQTHQGVFNSVGNLTGLGSIINGDGLEIRGTFVDGLLYGPVKVNYDGLLVYSGNYVNGVAENEVSVCR